MFSLKNNILKKSTPSVEMLYYLAKGVNSRKPFEDTIRKSIISKIVYKQKFKFIDQLMNY